MSGQPGSGLFTTPGTVTLTAEAAREPGRWWAQDPERDRLVFDPLPPDVATHRSVLATPVTARQIALVHMGRVSVVALYSGIAFYALRMHLYPGAYDPDWRDRPDLTTILLDQGLGVCR